LYWLYWRDVRLFLLLPMMLMIRITRLPTTMLRRYMAPIIMDTIITGRGGIMATMPDTGTIDITPTDITATVTMALALTVTMDTATPVLALTATPGEEDIAPAAVPDTGDKGVWLGHDPEPVKRTPILCFYRSVVR